MTTRDAMLFSVMLAVAIAAASAPARAQSPPALDVDAGAQDGPGEPWSEGVSHQDRRRARALFLEGNKLFKIPLFPRAIARYQAAVALWPHPRFYFNLAVAQSNHGDDVAARESFERALRHGREPLGEERHGEARRQRAQLESRLGRARIVCATRGAAVALDGKRAFDCGPERDERLVWLAPGEHEIVATRSGHLPVRQRVPIVPGAIRPVELALITLGQAHDRSRRWAVWKPWSVIGAGLALVAGGAALHARAAASYESHDEQFILLPCVTEPDESRPGCPAEAIPASLQDQLDRAERQQAIAVGLYVAGGAVIAAGVALQVLNRPRAMSQDSGEAGAPAAALVPLLSPGALGVSARFTFEGP